MRYKNLLRVLFSVMYVSIWASSCDTDSSTHTQKHARYQFEIVDSVVFSRLSEVKLIDYHEANEELLLMDRQTREMLVINKEGIALSIFQPHIEGPDYVGDWSIDWTFYGKDQLVSYSIAHLHLLSKSGERIKRLEYPIEINSTYSLDYNPKMIHNYRLGDTDKLLTIFPGAEGPNPRTQAYHDSLRQLVIMDMSGIYHKTLSGKPKQSTYRKLGRYVDPGWPTLIQLKGSLFANSYSIDRYVYVRDVEADSIVRILEIPEKHRPLFTAVAFNGNDRPDRQRINSRIMSDGDKIVLENLGRIPARELRIIQQLPDWRESDEYKTALRKYVYRNFLVFDQNEYLGELDLDIGGTYYDILSTEKGYFWIQRRYKDERDYKTFLKIKIMPSKR